MQQPLTDVNVLHGLHVRRFGCQAIHHRGDRALRRRNAQCVACALARRHKLHVCVVGEGQHANNGMRHFLLHAPQRDDTPGSAYGSPMTKINNASRETQLYLHTLASSLACATQTPMPVFQISGPREDSPSAQRVRVLEQLDETLTGLDTVIRSKGSAGWRTGGHAGAPADRAGRGI